MKKNLYPELNVMWHHLPYIQYILQIVLLARWNWGWKFTCLRGISEASVSSLLAAGVCLHVEQMTPVLFLGTLHSRFLDRKCVTWDKLTKDGLEGQ